MPFWQRESLKSAALGNGQAGAFGIIIAKKLAGQPAQFPISGETRENRRHGRWKAA
jgi:hypothetical protein